MWDRLLRNARVVDPVNGRDGVMDVAVKDGRIAAVGPNLQGEASEVEDLTGLVVMPGLIDPHLHLGSMFGSAYGTRMAAAAGVTTCLDMAGPVDEILETSKTCGAGINVAMLEGFSPMKHCGTMTPTREQLEKFVRESLEKGAVGVKIMGGHWPLPLETSRELVKTANDMNAYVAWHAGSHTAGSNILGMREVIEAAKGQRLHLAHINAYCRGRVNPVDEESKEAIEMLRANPNLWCEAYVSPNNGTVLDCDEDGQIIDHVTRTCLKRRGYGLDKAGMGQAILDGWASIYATLGGEMAFLPAEDGYEYWEKRGYNANCSFPVNNPVAMLAAVTATRPDGSFTVDAVSTDGGAIPRNVIFENRIIIHIFSMNKLDMQEFALFYSIFSRRYGYLPTTQGS